ncbi:MAG: Ig-like domain-containing protein, partial [Oscillospiraceae bacterium]|nr:Ig-like domain-containing protein [Oscillospiraceae bacterium]
MKKVLSLILAIAMIATFIPAVSAAEGDLVDATGKMTIKYNFEQVPSGTTDTNVTSWYKFENTNGFFEHRATTCKPRVITNGIRLQRKTGKGEYSIFRVWLPEGGDYDVYVDWEAGKNVLFDFHIGPNGSVAKDPVVGTLSSVTSKARSNDKLSTNPITLSEGYNYVIFSIPEGFTVSGSDGYLVPYSISLVSTSADKRYSAPFIKEYTAPAAQIDANTGKTTMAISTATVLSDSVTEAGEVTVEYSSSNDNIAKVDSNGNITAGVDGTATITAKVTAENSNCYVTKTATVMVGTGEYINPNDITVKYNFQQVPSGTTDANVTSWYTFENTNGFFEHRATTCKPRVITNGIRLQRKTGKGEHSIFRMWVPKSGAYDVYVDWEAGKNVLFDFHIGPDGSVAKDPVVGTLSSVTSKARSNDKLSTNPITLSEGYNYVIFRVSDNFTSGGSSDGWLIPHSISLVAGSADAIMGGEMTAPEAPLAIGATDTVSAKGYLSSTGAAASFTYASDNESAVTVNSTTGAIEAVGAGSATITATCADALSGYNTVSKTITVAAPEAPKAPNVALYVTASKGDAVSVIVNGAEKDINTALSEKRGANVTVTANDYEGHTFHGWVRGSA